MMRIVLDANVLASGFPAPDGVPGQLIEAWLQRKYDPTLSEHILAKVASTWDKPYFRARYHEEEARRALALLRRRGTFVTPELTVHGVAPSAEDDVVLATAVAARADYLVTGDGPFRRVGAYEGIVFINPRQFLDLLNGKDPDEWGIVDELRDAFKDVPEEEIERTND
ncbi:hypothetical protein BH23CHL3_BH23CHL3_11250 [soil metagenome]